MKNRQAGRRKGKTCYPAHGDHIAGKDVTYNPSLDPAARSLLHEVEIAFAQNDRVDVYLRDVRQQGVCVRCVGSQCSPG